MKGGTAEEKKRVPRIQCTNEYTGTRSKTTLIEDDRKDKSFSCKYQSQEVSSRNSLMKTKLCMRFISVSESEYLTN